MGHIHVEYGRSCPYDAPYATKNHDSVNPGVISETDHLVRSSLTRLTTAVWVLVHDDDAEAIRGDLSAGRPGHACDLLLNRAVELLPLVSLTPDLARCVKTCGIPDPSAR